MKLTLRTLFGATLLTMLLALTATVASAQYPPTTSTPPGGTPTLTVTPPQVAAGEQIRVCGTGFPASSTVAVDVLLEGSQIDTVNVNTDAAGAFCFDYTAPDPGSATNPAIVFSATASGVVVSGQSQITSQQPPSSTTTTTTAGTTTISDPPAQSSGDSLAFTGRSIGVMAGIGGVLLAAGAVMWFVAQRREPDAA